MEYFPRDPRARTYLYGDAEPQCWNGHNKSRGQYGRRRSFVCVTVVGRAGSASVIRPDDRMRIITIVGTVDTTEVFRGFVHARAANPTA